jgi:hypothetical protein
MLGITQEDYKNSEFQTQFLDMTTQQIVDVFPDFTVINDITGKEINGNYYMYYTASYTMLEIEPNFIKQFTTVINGVQYTFTLTCTEKSVLDATPLEEMIASFIV